MDDPHKHSPQATETKNILPDVVHSQQIPAVGDVVNVELEAGPTASRDEGAPPNAEDSHTESISEHIPSKVEYSTESENDDKDKLQVEPEQEKASSSSPGNIPFPHSPVSDNPGTHDYSKLSTSWPLDANVVSDVHISEESPVNLALSSDNSKELTQGNKSHTTSPVKLSAHESPIESPRSDYLDSLESSQKSDVSHESAEKSARSDNDKESPSKDSSGSEEIIKLDIRGQGAPKLPSAKIIFGPPPEGSTIFTPNMRPIPVFPNLLSPFLVGANENVKVEEIFNLPSKDISPQKSDEIGSVTALKKIDLSPEVSLKESLSDKEIQSGEVSPKESLSDKIEQSDLLIEELSVGEEMKEKEHQEDGSLPHKSMPAEETMSFSTMTTDYKTICEEYHGKLVHLEAAISQRDDLIEELTVSLQRSVRERDDLRHENQHLSAEVCNLQQTLGESDHDTIKAQLSDLFKYQSMVKDDSTKFYSALMSDGSSLRSSNGEKDNDREEITVNYSRSDLKSSDGSDDFQTGFEDKIGMIVGKFDEFIEENLRNKLRESLIQVLCDEIGKMRLEFDTEIKELESQMTQDKQAYTIETRRLRELLASVKAGSADIDDLRNELAVKHEKEMENLRTYFEKKCSDMERSYSEEVWRGRCASVAGSASPPEGAPDAAGDRARRRARSADLPSLSIESTPLEQAVKQIAKRYEQQLEDAKAEHLAYVAELQARQREVVGSMEDQISQLKTHIQNSESNVIYPQDIDLELEKKMESQLEQRLEEVRAQVRQDVVNHLQEQLQVLLSDPDAEVSSWPLELVALRDKIHGDSKPTQEKELSSLRDELSAGEDKWKQRRNLSFDQNRHLDEVTKERDELRVVALSLRGAVGELAAYCARAEDELNRTVLAALLARLLPDNDETLFIEDEPSPETPNQSVELNTSAVSRGGKHVHFAPDLNSILTDLDESGIMGFLQQQRDVSADIRRELEAALRRLRSEARDLLHLSEKLANRKDSRMLESSVQITELVEEIESKQRCANCEMHQKNMQEAMAECLQRESLLRADLEHAMMKIAQLVTGADVIAEGYGTGTGLHLAESAPPAPPARRLDPPSPAASPAPSPRAPPGYVQDLDALQRERDDLHQQLEAANRQLRSTRQFVEEQASERESERDEFARRLQELREENSRLSARLQSNARILSEMRCLRLSYCNCREHDAHVEQLETQAREMNQMIAELETKKATTDEELKAAEEKTTLLRDIIANLESQLEQKNTAEKEILQQLEQMKQTIEDRDSKMRSLLGELETAKSEKADQSSNVSCVTCTQEEDKLTDFMEKVKEQCRVLEQFLHRRTRRLERAHEECSASCSEPSEDVSLRDTRGLLEPRSPECEASPRGARLAELAPVWERLEALARAEDAACKRIADLEMQRSQLKDVAQEVRAERDVLQARMSEQALRISSLAARLQRARHGADAAASAATAHLSVQLHDVTAEVQRLKEELESKDKQLMRLKQSLEEKEKLDEQHQSLYGNSCNPKDKVVILERELSSAQARTAQLEQLAASLEADKDELNARVRELTRALAERDEQLHELMALKLDDENKEKSEVYEGKASGRTLSDIVSISEFDEQDLQMRRAELKAQNLSLTGAPFVSEKMQLNATLPPEVPRHNMSSLHIESVDHFDLPNHTPRADSLPAHLTSTQNKQSFIQYKRNANETTMFGTIDKLESKVSTAQKIPDNCSLYPNREVDETKDNSVEPKKIDFSLEPTVDNKSNEEEFTSLRELGITLDIKQENFPDILTQLKHEIKKSRTELETCKSELKNAEEQLCEFPALKEEVEELKALLENTMGAMDTDKKFYENQLEHFSSNKKLLEQRLAELTQEVNDKSKDLHLLKEDILRRENMILELAKEKRNLTNKMTELQVKIDELQSRNTNLEKCESENHQLREKASELQRLEQLVSEKNQQIDSLNQHLDRLDDLQRCLTDKTEELDNLKEAFEEKSNELFRLQDTVEALNRDIAKLNEDNENLNTNNKELTLKLTKLEKEQENASFKLQTSETELNRMNSLNTELTLKIEELKLLTHKLKDKETEIEILNEDINAFHEEIATLKEQLKMASRSPSPPNKGEERRVADRQATGDKKQLVKIRKQISLLQHELDFNKKELNDQAFELAKARLDVTELRNTSGRAAALAAERDSENARLKQRCEALTAQVETLELEKRELAEKLEAVTARLREESDVSELRAKLQRQMEVCRELEAELQDMRELAHRQRSPLGGAAEAPRALAARSPTAELERAVRDQLHYSHTLDEDFMEQILSASSDEREDIPRLALNSSKSSSSIHSSTSERAMRLRAENDKLRLHVDNLEARLKDKDALIAELNRVRDKLVADWQSSRLRLEAERENAGRLQLLLDTHKETAQSLQNQDTNMIQILKKRLESSMQSELELQQREQLLKARAAQLERQLLAAGDGQPARGQLQLELENNSRLSGEVTLLKSRLEIERAKCQDAEAALQHARAHAQREKEAREHENMVLKGELAEVKRLKHEATVELLRAKELLSTQSNTIAELERKLTAASARQRPNITEALTEIENQKTYLSREMTSLKECLLQSSSPSELTALRADRTRLTAAVSKLEAELQARPTQEDWEQMIRSLQSRALRLESWRKALAWQKRYLQRVLAGYAALERSLAPAQRVTPRTPLQRFKCASLAVVAALRLRFVSRRRHQVRAVAAACLLRANSTHQNHTPVSQYTGTSPPSRERPAPAGGAGGAAAGAGGAAGGAGLARRVLRQEGRLNLPASPGVADFGRRSPFHTSSPREEPFILNSPRGEMAATYLNKLELVSRCLNHAMDTVRDVP